MPIDFACACGKRLRAGDLDGGKSSACPRCGAKVTVPVPPVFAAPNVDPDDTADGMLGSYQPPPPPSSNGTAVHDPDPDLFPTRAAVATASPPAPAKAMAVPPDSIFDGERVFLDERGILVTDRRLAVTRRTYAMAHLVSVAQAQRDANLLPHSALLLFSGALILAGVLQFADSLLVSIVLTVFGLGTAIPITMSMLKLQPTHQVVFGFSSGSTHIVEDLDLDLALRLASATRRAIVFRG